MPIHRTAVVDPAAMVEISATIGAHVVIEGPAKIGADCHIGPGAIILGHTTLERGCRIHSHAVVGDLPQDHKYTGGVSYCLVGEGTTIREGATVHRGTADGSATVVGKHCLLMTNSHVGHNCQLGNQVTLVSGSLLGGHVQVGDRAVISGNAAVHQFVRIGELALVGMLGRIVQDVPPFCITDRNGRVVAENRVGMMRAGLTRSEREELKAAYRALHRSGIGRNDAINYLHGAIKTDAGRRLLDFFIASSGRGVGIRAFKPSHAA